MRAFERQEGESQKAFDAFTKYLDLGPERTLALATDAVYGRHKSGKRTQPVGQIVKWAKCFDWQERAQAWDDLLHMTRLQGAEDAEREKAYNLAAREQNLDEEILSLKEALIPRLKQMAAFPLVRTTKEETVDGKKVVTNIYPARWSFNTVVNALGVLKDVDEQGLSLNLNIGSGEASDLSVLTDEELEVYERINDKLRGSPFTG